jgi:hypothetical protein
MALCFTYIKLQGCRFDSKVSVLSMHNTVKRSFRHLSDWYLMGFKPMDAITHQQVCVCSGMFGDKVVRGEGLQWNGSGVLQAGKWQGVVLIC